MTITVSTLFKCWLNMFLNDLAWIVEIPLAQFTFTILQLHFQKYTNSFYD